MDAYEQYGRALLRKAERILGSRDDARDVVQSLFVDLAGAPHAADFAYLYRAVTNRCITVLRDESNRARLRDRHDEALRGPPRTRVDDDVIGTDFLQKLVKELEDGEAEVLAYRFLDDMTQDEIAEALGLSRKTIGKRLDRIRAVVRRMRAEGERREP